MPHEAKLQGKPISHRHMLKGRGEDGMNRPASTPQGQHASVPPLSSCAWVLRSASLRCCVSCVLRNLRNTTPSNNKNQHMMTNNAFKLYKITAGLYSTTLVPAGEIMYFGKGNYSSNYTCMSYISTLVKYVVHNVHNVHSVTLEIKIDSFSLLHRFLSTPKSK